MRLDRINPLAQEGGYDDDLRVITIANQQSTLFYKIVRFTEIVSTFVILNHPDNFGNENVLLRDRI